MKMSSIFQHMRKKIEDNSFVHILLFCLCVISMPSVEQFVHLLIKIFFFNSVDYEC